MFRNICLAFAASSFLLPCSPNVIAQNEPPRHPGTPKVLGLAEWKPTPQQVNAPYWTLEPGWNTELEVRNNLAQRELRVTPVLLTAMGREILLPEVSVAPEEVVSIDLQRVVSNVDPATVGRLGSFGSALFRFAGLSPANIFAASLVRREGYPIEFHFDGGAIEPTYSSSGIEGIWWLPAETSNDYLILSNPSARKVNGTLVLTSPSAPTQRIAFTVDPKQTARIDLRQALGASAKGQLGGLRVLLPKKDWLPSSEIVFDETTGLSAIMKLFDRDPQEQTTNHVLRAPMMALSQPDPALVFPEGTTLVPRIFLWNASGSTMPVSLALDWRSENGFGTYNPPPVKLAAGEAKVLDLSTFQRAGKIPTSAQWSTVRLGYTGRTADLVPVALSYDEASRYGVQTPFSEGTSPLFKGSMWHVDAIYNTIITTGNGGSEPTAAEVKLFYNEGKDKYRVEKTLAPGQQLWLNVRELIRNQVPDSDGHTIPPEIMAGSYELRDLDHGLVGQLYEGKLVIDKTYGHAAYGCGSCCGYDQVNLMPSPFGGPPNINNDDLIQANASCTGQVVDVTYGGYNWASSKTAVATLPTRTLHTVAVGTATGSAYIKLTSPGPQHQGECPQITWYPAQGVCVTTLTFSGTANNFIFVGTDPNILSANTYFLQYSPTGGTFSGSSSNSGDSVTFTPASGLEKAQVQTTVQSTSVGDRTLTFSYTPPSCPAQPLTQTVTARQFAYVANNSPSNQCTLGYGTKRTYTYTVYTHPDRAALDSSSGLDGTPVAENFDQTPKCLTHTGDGNLNSNDQFSDNVIYCGNTPLTCSETRTQTLSIAGVPVRTNTLQAGSSGVTYTNDGPTQ